MRNCDDRSYLQIIINTNGTHFHFVVKRYEKNLWCKFEKEGKKQQTITEQVTVVFKLRTTCSQGTRILIHISDKIFFDGDPSRKLILR